MTVDAAGGVFTYALDLIRGLAREDVEVVVAILGGAPSSDQRAALEAAAPAAVFESSLRLEWMSDPWDDLARAENWLLAIEQRERPDVVHGNSFFCGAVPWRAPALVVGHSCVVSWWRAVHGTAPPPSWERYRQVVSSGLFAADAVVAPSAAMLGALRRNYGAFPGRTAVIHNGSSAPAHRGAAKEPFVLAAGRSWDAAKNFAALERAARRRRLPVMIAGDDLPPAAPGAGSPGGEGAGSPGGEGSGSPGGEGSRSPGGEGSGSPGGEGSGGVRRLGRLTAEELSRLRRRATVFAAPARYEPFGLAILEAARDGCALVLGDIPSLRELWGDGARYVAPDDDFVLAATLEELLSDPAAATALGGRAQRRAGRYTTAAMARRYRALYDDLLAARARVAA